jgi:hypothetical protein
MGWTTRSKILLLLAALCLDPTAGSAAAAAPEPDTTRLLENGSAALQFVMAQRYENAEGVPRDYAKALAFYCAAAEQGHAGAAYGVGWIFLNGRGVPHSDAMGAAWLRVAAARGEPHALRILRHLGTVPTQAPGGCPERYTASTPSPPPAKIVALVTKTAPKYRVDPKLVLAVISAESAFQANAVSPKNAKGLMQLMPDTAERFGVKNSFDPADNIKGGVRYLRWLLAYFEGDTQKVIAAYNAGEGAVDRYGGVPPYPETKAYLRKVQSLYRAKHHPYDRLALAGE